MCNFKSQEKTWSIQRRQNNLQEKISKGKIEATYFEGFLSLNSFGLGDISGYKELTN